MASTTPTPATPSPSSPPSTTTGAPGTGAEKSNSRWESGLVETAGHEGMRGAAVGATKWGLATAALGLAGWRFSPLYRTFTLQFKVFIQMSGMILGATVESDRRMREFEYRARVQRRIARHAAQRRHYEFDDDDDD